MRENRVIYRYPFSTECHRLTAGEEGTEELGEVEQLRGKEGFVIAPFHPTADAPIVLLREFAEEVFSQEEGLARDEKDTEGGLRTKRDSLDLSGSSETRPPHDEARKLYANDFALFHEQLKRKTFEKLVLARSATYPLPPSAVPVTPTLADTLFFTACKMYPAQFVALVDTAATGTWIVASPEILLHGNGRQWHTMALAGTRPHRETDEPWSEKNMHEQGIVADYIRQTLLPFAAAIDEEQPSTLTAGGMDHICTRFHFALDDPSATIAPLVAALHPTPAVCGLPKEEALAFILKNEHTRRSYYSGFMGMLSPLTTTRLFVTLRCMQLQQSTATLYAGGGLIEESEEATEWQETQLKMSRMMKVLGSLGNGGA